MVFIHKKIQGIMKEVSKKAKVHEIMDFCFFTSFLMRNPYRIKLLEEKVLIDPQ